jgi:hypothetical protein
MANAKKAVAKKTATVTELKPSAALIAAADKELKKAKAGEQSKCEAIRVVAAKFPKERRIMLEQVFVKQHRMNVGTVRRQIQEGRAAA